MTWDDGWHCQHTEDIAALVGAQIAAALDAVP